MDDFRGNRLHPSLELEVTPINRLEDTAGSPSPHSPHSPFESHLSHAKRTQRLVVGVGVVFLALVTDVGALTPFRDRGIAAVAALFPTPTSTLPPDADLFYFVPAVPWGTVSLDDRSLSQLPEPGDAQPLRLARGRHQLEWQSAPFESLHCTISVPHSSMDTCPITTTQLPSQGHPESIITLHESLNSLDPSSRAELINAIQGALTNSQMSAVVQPGEQFYFYFGGKNQSHQYVTNATQPLHAELHLQPLLGQAGAEACVSDPGVQPCYFVGQDCGEICTLPAPANKDASCGWTAAVLVRSSWDYRRLDGALVSHLDGGAWEPKLNLHAVVVQISWADGQWHVTPTFGHESGSPVTDEVACAPARDLLAEGPLRDMLFAANATARLLFSSASDPAEGCAVSVADSAGGSSAVPTAVFLFRFGGLLAVNDAARRLWPALPSASPFEHQLAQQMEN